MGRFVASLSLIIAAMPACVADQPTTEQRCEQVRDQLIDLRLANVTGIDIKAHRTAMKDALGDAFMTSCRTNLTVAQQQCVLKARDAASCWFSADPDP